MNKNYFENLWLRRNLLHKNCFGIIKPVLIFGVFAPLHLSAFTLNSSDALIHKNELITDTKTVLQDIKITGVVTDDQNLPIPSVAVTIKGTTSGTITGINGEYAVSVPNENAVLIFSSLGFASQEVKASKTILNIRLEVSSTQLNEVVAIGYATIKRKDLTGSSVSVTGDELKISPVTTAAQALTGKAAGVSIVTQSGAPGADYNIVIRGGSTITGSAEPLYIVDGFQMDKALSNIDINDIATIDIMKDASSTAIYGTRGSNGVVIITTKSAKAGKSEVNYNNYFGFEKLGKKLDLLNIVDYTKYQYEYQVLAGKEANWAAYFGGDVADPNFYTGAYGRIQNDYGTREAINWQDEVFGGQAVTQNHNININGGNEKTRFLLSLNNTGQNGILAKHDYSKNSLRFKLNHEILKGIRTDFNTSYQSTKIDGGGSLGGALKSTILQPATGGVRYTNQQLLTTDLSDDLKAIDSQYDIYNPIIVNDAVNDNSISRLFTANAGLEFDIFKNLLFRTAGSYMMRQNRDDYWDDGRTVTAQNNGGPYGARNTGENYNWQLTNTLNWTKTFNKDHEVTALLGQEIYYANSIALNNTYYGFPADNFDLDDVSQSDRTRNTYSSGKSHEGLSSFFGRASYNYKGKYILSGTLRADGSSKFGNGHKWGYFPSVAGAWRISDENFMKNLQTVNNLKLRVGYGTSGNNRIGNNLYATDYGSGTYAINNASFQTLVPGNTLGNPEIVWEKVISTNLGLDIDLWKSRLAFNVDLYNNKSDQLLIRNSIPTSTGYSYQIQNIGAISNKGIEVVAKSTNISNKNFKWGSGFNIAFNRSKVLNIYGIDQDDFFLQNYNSRIDYKIQVGQPLGQFFGYRYDGVYTTDDFTQNANGTYKLKDGVARLKGSTAGSQKPGDVKYKPTAGETDTNGNPTWSTNDRTVIGNAQPKFQGGFTNNFRYKNFDLTVFMNFSYGNEIFNMSSQRFIGPYLPNQNTLDVMNSRFKLVDPQTGKESTDLSRLAALNPQQFDKDALWSLHASNKIAISDALDYYLEDGSYLRVGTITMGYTIPKNLLQKIKLKNARIYATVNNPFTFTNYSGYDPEVSATSSILTTGVDNSSYPRARTFVFGLNLSL